MNMKAFAPAILLICVLAGCKISAQAAPTEDSAAVEQPADPPMQGHEPPPVTGPEPTASIYGAAAIKSEFAVSSVLQAAWGSGKIPGTSAPDVLGAFRFICGAGQIRYDDPIVYPGQPGKSHLHQFFGNVEADANSTFSSLRRSGDSTCNWTGKGIAANRSAYWMPAMLDGKGHVVQPERVAIYYKQPPSNGPLCAANSPTRRGICVPIPNGLKFIFGYDMVTGKPPTGGTYFNCADAGSTQGRYPSIPAAKAHCEVGGRLIPTIAAPTCWDGKRLDSPNHRDHVSYLTEVNGVTKCPSTHPYMIPRFTMAVSYRVEAGDDHSLWRLSSDAMHPELPHGSTFHADYFEAWDNDVKMMWQTHCIDRLLSCTGGDLGNGKQLIGAAQPSYGKVQPNRLVPIP